MGFDFEDGGSSKSESTQFGISDSFGSQSGSSFSRSRSKSSSRPSNPDELAGFFNKLDSLTGGRVSGVAQSPLQPLGPEQIQALGGLGATREARALAARQRVLDEIEADPSLTLFQRQRAAQLADEDFRNTTDSIAKETGAQITALARLNALDKIESDLAQLEALADIFFGGKGQHSKSSSSSESGSSSSGSQESHSTSFGESTSESDGGGGFGIKIA